VGSRFYKHVFSYKRGHHKHQITSDDEDVVQNGQRQTFVRRKDWRSAAEESLIVQVDRARADEEGLFRSSPKKTTETVRIRLARGDRSASLFRLVPIGLAIDRYDPFWFNDLTADGKGRLAPDCTRLTYMPELDDVCFPETKEQLQDFQGEQDIGKALFRLYGEEVLARYDFENHGDEDLPSKHESSDEHASEDEMSVFEEPAGAAEMGRKVYLRMIA
jgi:hypothetical protein